MKLIICNDTFLKDKPENPDLLAESEKRPLFVGDWLEVESAWEYPKGHYQVKIGGKTWYCYKFFSTIEY